MVRAAMRAAGKRVMITIRLSPRLRPDSRTFTPLGTESGENPEIAEASMSQFVAHP